VSTLFEYSKRVRVFFVVGLFVYGSLFVVYGLLFVVDCLLFVEDRIQRMLKIDRKVVFEDNGGMEV